MTLVKIRSSPPMYMPTISEMPITKAVSLINSGRVGQITFDNSPRTSAKNFAGLTTR